MPPLPPLPGAEEAEEALRAQFMELERIQAQVIDDNLLSELSVIGPIEPLDLNDFMGYDAVRNDSFSINTAELFGSDSSYDDQTLRVYVVPDGSVEVAAGQVDATTNTDESVGELLESIEEHLRGPNERHLKRKFSAFLEQLTDKQVHELITKDLFNKVTREYLASRPGGTIRL